MFTDECRDKAPLLNSERLNRPESRCMAEKCDQSRASSVTDDRRPSSSSNQNLNATDPNAHIEPGQRTQIDAAIRIIDENCVLWHTPDDQAFATFDSDGHSETWFVQSRGFQRWLGAKYYKRFRKSLSPESLNAAIRHADAVAVMEGGLGDGIPSASAAVRSFK